MSIGQMKLSGNLVDIIDAPRRWSFYLLLIWTGLMLLSVVALVPETYSPVLLRRKAEKLRKETGNDRWRAPIELQDRSMRQTILWSLIRPFQLLVLGESLID